VLVQLRRKAIRPLIAHPERCAHFHEPGAAEAAVQAGAALQLNLGSLWGRYGRGVRKHAARLLEAGLYAVAASDLHHAEDAGRWLEKALRELEKEAGVPAVRRLLEVNPARIVRGEELEE
jgi:protein-tyrosine phosphatase